MSVVVTTVSEEYIEMFSDIGFSDDSIKWVSRNTLKIIPYTDRRGNDVLVGITGNASQLTLVKAFLNDCTARDRSIAGDEKSMFEFAVNFNKFSQDLGIPTGVEVDGSFSTHHVVADGRAWVIQGYFISEILEWDVMGSGDPFARAALHLGHDPVQAVRVACEYDLYCYGPPVSFKYHRAQRKLISHNDKLATFYDEE